MTRKTIIFIIVFLLIVSVSYGQQTVLTIIEDFSNVETFNKASNTLEFWISAGDLVVSEDCFTSSSPLIDTICIFQDQPGVNSSENPAGTIFNWSTEAEGFHIRYISDSFVRRPLFVVKFLDDLLATETTVLKFEVNSSREQPSTWDVVAQFKLDTELECAIGFDDQSADATFETNKKVCNPTQPNILNATEDIETGESNYANNNITILNITFDFLGVNQSLFNTLYFYVRYHGGSQAESSNLYSFELENVLNGSNRLPEFDVRFLGAECANQSLDEIGVNVTINATDFENDTILFSLKANENNLWTVVGFRDRIPTISRCKYGLHIPFTQIVLFQDFEWSCSEDPITIFYPIPIGVTFPAFLFGTGSVDISRAGKVNMGSPLPTYERILDSCFILTDINNNTEFYVIPQVNKNRNITEMLVLNPSCARHREAYLKTDYFMQSFSYSTNMYYRNEFNNTFNLTFYDSPITNDIMLRLKFFVGDNVLEVYNVNSTNQTLITNFSIVDSIIGFNGYMGLDLSYDFINNVFNITIGDIAGNLTRVGSLPGFIVTNQNLMVRYIGLSIANDFVYQENFMYGGFTLNPDFSETIPTIVQVIGFGKNQLNVYVTDDVHSVDEFTFKSIDFTVEQCSQQLPDLTSRDMGLDLAPLKSAFTGVCTALDNAFIIQSDFFGEIKITTFGFCFMFKFIWFLLTGLISAGFTLWIALARKSLAFPMFFLLWSIFGMMGWVILPYGDLLKFTVAIMFSLSMVIIIRILFISSEGGVSV